MNNGTGVWAFTVNGDVKAEGAFSDCWKYAVENHGDVPLGQWEALGLKLGKVR